MITSFNETFTLNNGIKIPVIGFGTYQSENETATTVTLEALKIGYRHIDTAAYYNNEVSIGKAIAASDIPRNNIFVTSKVWNTERGYEKTKAAFNQTLKKLDLDYLDLYLIHWPANTKQFGDQAEFINAETWRALEDLYKEGKVKAIGVSNFQVHHLEALLKTATITPMVNQIEFHPGWMQEETLNYCQKNNILVEAWSPLGRRAVLENETLQTLAHKYQKSTAQLCIRWCLQHQVLPLPKSVTPSRILENTEVFDFNISSEDMAKIDALKDIGGQCLLPDRIRF